MSMKWVGGLNLNHNNPHKSPTPEETSGWGCIVMTTSRSSICWNTLYIYKVDLL